MVGPKIKRFYKSVYIDSADRGYIILLDDRPVRTPMKNLLVLPSKRLATVVAAEWESQSKFIDQKSMLMTRYSNTALDRVQPNRVEIIDNIIKFSETDLVCYRVEEPVALAKRQIQIWQPHLDWLRESYNVRLVSTTGINHVEQDPVALSIIRRLLEDKDEFSLTGLHALTIGTGSIVLGLAVIDGVLDAANAFNAGYLDELYQTELWGEVPEANIRYQRVRSELLAVETFLNLFLDKY